VKDVPLNRANLRVRCENGAILGRSKFVSGYVERDKKNVEKFDFCSQIGACLIERQNSVQRIGKGKKFQFIVGSFWFVVRRKNDVAVPATAKR